MTANSSNGAGWPRLRYLPAAELRTYQVAIQRRPRGPLHVLGIVTRFGSLPSMRGWKAQPAEGGAWTRKRQARADAAGDLRAALCLFCAARAGGGVEHELTLAETQADGLWVIRCDEHPHEPARPAVADFSRPVDIDY